MSDGVSAKVISRQLRLTVEVTGAPAIPMWEGRLHPRLAHLTIGGGRVQVAVIKGRVERYDGTWDEEHSVSFIEGGPDWVTRLATDVQLLT